MKIKLDCGAIAPQRAHDTDAGVDLFSPVSCRIAPGGSAVIDAGYTGSIRVKLYNHGADAYDVHSGDKISQLVILPCMIDRIEIVDRIGGGERGDDGFGSTGR